MSISKFAASVLSGTQETTVALAALNFDFALFKTEAPKEYKALGSALTPYRREVAEDGDIHATARKLRAMFEQILPPTPSLYTAYGMRASEIASRYAFMKPLLLFSTLEPQARCRLSLFRTRTWRLDGHTTMEVLTHNGKQFIKGFKNCKHEWRVCCPSRRGWRKHLGRSNVRSKRILNFLTHLGFIVPSSSSSSW